MTETFTPRMLVPTAVTCANIVAGFLSMLAASEGRFEAAVYLLVVAVLFDLFDGKVARRLQATSKFGQEMDSFSDAVSFSAAPAFLVQRATLQSLGAVGIVVSTLFLLAGVLRLARFNLTSDAHSKARRTIGVPTPIGAGYLMALVLMRDRVPPAFAAALVAVMAVLMISRLSLPEISGRGVLGFAFLIGFGNFFAVVLWPNWLTVVWWNAWNFVILIAATAQERATRADESEFSERIA